MSTNIISLPEKVDGIFIGAGHNGLIAANYLARAGASVLVLESQPKIGGGLTTEEITLPLFKHNLHAYFVRLNPNYRIWTDLQLSKYGIETVLPEVQTVIPFRAGGALIAYNSIEKSVASIRQFSSKDADTYARVYAEFEELASRVIDPLRFSAPLPADQLDSLLGRSKLGQRYKELAQYALLDLVHELFEHEATRTMVLFNVSVRAYLPHLDVPGTGYILPLALYGSHHGAMVKGGTIQAARAFAAGVYEHGGMVVTDARVERIIVEQGRASGIELSDGRTVQANKFICSNVPAALTLTKMIEARHLDSDLLEAARNYRWNEESLFGVHLALREAPQYGSAALDEPIHQALNYCLGYESSDDFLRDMQLMRDGTIPTTAALHVGVPTVFDTSQAPPGYSTAFAWQFVPSRPADGGPDRWQDNSAGEAFAELMVAGWQEYAPNLADAEIARGIHSPLDTFLHVPSMMLGDRHLGSNHPDNFDTNRPHPDLSGYGTPIEGLYHCGADTYPGGSFTGQPGYNAATRIVKDMGYNIWWNAQDPHDVLPES